MKKKILSIFLVMAIVLSFGNVTALASEVNNGRIREVEPLYLIDKQGERDEILPENVASVNSMTVSMEIDMLAEIEAFLRILKKN